MRVMVSLYVLASVVATYLLMATEGNAVTLLIKLLGPIALVAGVVQPRVGFGILVLACGYLDFLKRVAYYFGYYNTANQGVDTLQVSILSFAPLTLLGILGGVIGRRVLITKRLVVQGEWPVVFLVLCVNLFVLATGYLESKDVMLAMTKAVNEGIYLLMLFLIPVLFPAREDMLKVMRYVIIAFIPCALYGIWQGLFGYTQLDLVWMNSGITVTIGLLGDLRARAFGTMASPHPYGILYWIALFGVYLGFDSKGHRLTYLSAAVFYLFALFFGYGRGAWLAFFGTLVAMYCFRTKRAITLFYGGALAIFAILVTCHQFLLDHLGDFQSVIPIESETAEMSFRLATFSDRLYSIRNWTTDGRLWTWFGQQTYRDRLSGAPVRHDELIHDMFGQILQSHGAVGLFGSVILGASALFYAHRASLRITDPKTRSMAIFFLSLVTVITFTGALLGSNFSVFPLNCFIWLAAGWVLAACRTGHQPAAATGFADPFPKNLQPPRRNGASRGIFSASAKSERSRKSSPPSSSDGGTICGKNPSAWSLKRRW